MTRMTLKGALRVYAQHLRAKYRSEHRLVGRRLSLRQEKESLEVVARATNSSTSAVLSWVRRQTKPVGEAELRLMCHLERRGFQIIEIENLDTDVREILWAISLNNFSLSWAIKRLGFSRQTEFLKVLRGTVLPIPDQVRKISRLITMMEQAEIEYLRTLEEQLERQGLLDDGKSFEKRMRRLRKKKVVES